MYFVIYDTSTLKLLQKISNDGGGQVFPKIVSLHVFTISQKRS